MSSKVRVNEDSVDQQYGMIIARGEGDEFWTSYLVITNILLAQGGMERGTDDWADGSASPLCSNSIWPAATGKREPDEWRRVWAYFTVRGLKWGKAWQMSWWPSVKCLHTRGEQALQRRRSAAHSLKVRHPLSNVMSVVWYSILYSLPNCKEEEEEEAAFSWRWTVLKTPSVVAVNLACRGL